MKKISKRVTEVILFYVTWTILIGVLLALGAIFGLHSTIKASLELGAVFVLFYLGFIAIFTVVYKEEDSL